MRNKETSLYIFAHPDDEFFILPLIEKEKRERRRHCVIYTTNGAAYGITPEERMNESMSVLKECGVGEPEVHFLGTQLSVIDGRSHQHLELLWKRIQEIISGKDVGRVVVPSWEGGHQDHDAAHLLGVAAARLLNLESAIYEYSLYHSYRIPAPFFRVMSFLPSEVSPIYERVSLRGAVRWASLCLRYKSQRRTFAGLSPFFLPKMVLARRCQYRPVCRLDYTRKPHEGPMLYETRFKVSFEEFSKSVKPFLLSCSNDFAFT